MPFSHIIELDEGDNSRRILDSADDNGGTFDCGIFGDGVFDFTKLDALPTELDLTVSTSTVFDVTIRTVECNITRLVDALARDEGAWKERSCCEFWLIQVATRKLNASDVQFTFNTDGGRLELLVENVDAAVGKGTANNASECRTSNMARGTIYGGFRGSIHVA